MSRPHSLLAALIATSIVVTGALAWFGWNLIDRERALETQRAQERAATATDALASAFRSRLAEAGDRLSAWVSDPGSPLPEVGGAAVLGLRGADVAIAPPGALPFVPFWFPASPASPLFAAAETLEFGSGQPERAAQQYRSLARHPAPAIRAGALYRLGRVFKRLGDHRGALGAYRELSLLGALQVDGQPAELRGLDGLLRLYRAQRDDVNAARVSEAIVRRIDDGRWLLSRGQAAEFRDSLTDKPYPESWRLAEALAEVWAADENGPSSRGQQIVQTGTSETVVVWRSGRTGTAALAAPVRTFFASLAPAGSTWVLTLASPREDAPAGALSRVIAATETDWILHVLPPPEASPDPARERLVVGAVAAAAGFIWIATLFIGRAIAKEARVARLQSDFVAAVSHEFRTPVTAVRQMSEMLDMERLDDPERVRQYHRVLVGEALRLQRLVETLLTFGRMEAGAKRYQLVATEIGPVVRGAMADADALTRSSAVTIEADGPEGVLVDADEDALRLALRNLLENAIKYSPGRPSVWVRWRLDHGRVLIDVEDKGLGIPRGEQRSIFRKFVRGRSAVDARVKGTGVGLAVVQHIVAAHGGDLSVRSAPGEGSTFTIALPAHRHVEKA